MKALLISFAMAWPMTLSLSAQTEQNGQPLNAKAGEEWTIRWNRSDDFNGDQIDWRKWQLRPAKFPAWSWDNEKNTSVSDGILKITLRRDGDTPAGKKPGGSKAPADDFTSGMLKSHAKGCYGYYEARIKGAPLFPGVCPAFWLFSDIDDSVETKGAVRYSEIDIVEMTQRGDHEKGNERIMDHNLHAILSNGNKGVAGREWRRPHLHSEAQATEYRAPFDPREAFHTYGCRVDKEEIVWYVDGIEVGRKKNALWHRPMNVALSFGLRTPFVTFTNNRLVRNPGVDGGDLPTSMLVDYVRVWELASGPK